MESKKKTKVCRHWNLGKCRYGEQCLFLHSHRPVDHQAPQTKERESESMTNPSKGEALKQKSEGVERTTKVSKSTKTSAKPKFNDYGEEIWAVTPQALDDSSESAVSITDYEFLASYNWCEGTQTRKPTVFVPGCPPRWNSLDLPVQVPKDSGREFIDQNSFRYPDTAYNPMFESLLKMRPGFDMNGINLITDRNNLRKLLYFAGGHRGDGFRIDVEVIKDTLILIRREKSNARYIGKGDKNGGYGHGFESAFSSFDKGLEESLSHHRIVQYDLGGLKCILRFEADAYICADLDASDAKARSLKYNSGQEKWLENGLKSLAIDNGAETSKTAHAAVCVIDRGQIVPVSSIAEAKSTSKKVEMSKVKPQMWFSQTQHLIKGHHQDGIFDRVDSIDMTDTLKEWEESKQSEIKRMLALLNEIKKVVKSTLDGKCVVMCPDKRSPLKLSIHALKGSKKSVISEETRKLFWGEGLEK